MIETVAFWFGNVLFGWFIFSIIFLVITAIDDEEHSGIPVWKVLERVLVLCFFIVVWIAFCFHIEYKNGEGVVEITKHNCPVQVEKK